MSTKICLNAFDAAYAHLHNSPMAKHNVQKLLAAIKEAKGLKTQTDLAGFIGRSVSQPQVSRWMRGDQEPDRNYYDLIVAAAERAGLLDVSSEDMAAALPGPILRKTVKLKGYVGAGSEAHFYALADEEYEEVLAPANGTDRTVAVEIKGTSMGPHLVSWLVYYDDIHSPVAESLIGKLCVVGLADDRILIKKIQRGRNGTYRLLSNHPDEPVIEDAEIEWAAPVTSMAPRS